MMISNRRLNFPHLVNPCSNNTLLHLQSSHHGPAELAHQGTALDQTPLGRIVLLQERPHCASEGLAYKEHQCEGHDEHRKARKRKKEIEK